MHNVANALSRDATALARSKNLLVSAIKPLQIISSTMKCAFSRLYLRSENEIRHDSVDKRMMMRVKTQSGGVSGDEQQASAVTNAHDVKLAHVLEVAVESFHNAVYEL